MGGGGNCMRTGPLVRSVNFSGDMPVISATLYPFFTSPPWGDLRSPQGGIKHDITHE